MRQDTPPSSSFFFSPNTSELLSRCSSSSFFFLIDAGVGKSSLLLRFTDDSYDEHIQSTIGVDFKVKHAVVSGKRVKMTVWDTAGQERFRTLTSSYYRGAQGVVLTYDVTRRDTFDNLATWLNEVCVYSPNGGSGVVKLLVGNKVDLLADGKDGGGGGVYSPVPREEAAQWAKERGMLFLEASAKSRQGVKQCFMDVVSKILEDPELLANTAPGKPKMALQPKDEEGKAPGSGGGGCC